MATRKTFGMRKSQDGSAPSLPPEPAPRSFAKSARPPEAPPPKSIRPHPGPDDGGVSNVFPKHISQGDNLDRIDMTPDDPVNILPTRQTTQATAETSEAEQKRFLEALNASLPDGVSVVPWAMIPWTIWKTDRAPFLMLTCELFPAAPWNQFLLPEDAESAAALGLPEHPREYPPGMEIAAQGNLERIEEEFSAAHKVIEQRALSGDASTANSYTDLRKAIQWKVMTMANSYASITFGEEAYDRHLKLFGKSLGSPVLDALLAKPQLN